MIVFDIAVVLTIMLLYIVLPGLPLSFILLKKSQFAERLAVSSIFGTIQLYIIYFGLKNGLVELYISTIFIVLVLFIASSFLIFNDVRRGFCFRFKFV